MMQSIDVLNKFCRTTWKVLVLACLGTLCSVHAEGERASIALTSQPDHADVWVNGAVQGSTPTVLSGLAAGSYLIELHKEGYQRAYRNVNLLEGQQLKLDMKMKPETGLLLVRTDPAGVELLVDGASRGQTPVLLSDLALGKYEIEFRAPKLMPRRMDVEIKGRTPQKIDAKLAMNTARLTVTSEPSDAEFRVNGVLMGKTPVVIDEIPAGDAELRVSKRGYKPYFREMTIEAARPYEVIARLESLPSGLTIVSDPSGAEIMVDKKSVGTSPVTVDNLAEGAHEVRAQLKGYADESTSIYLDPDVNDMVELKLVKNSGVLVFDTEPAEVQVFVNGELYGTTTCLETSDTLSEPMKIVLKAGEEHMIQLVREGFASITFPVEIEVDQILTRHEVMKRIFVYDTRITTDTEVIDCRLEYKLPNGDIYYERFPGVFATAKAEFIRDISPISIDDKVNRSARKELEIQRRTP